jgi:Uma2 family endonuclease
MSVQLLRRSFTVEDYHRMAQAGILSEDDRVELIDGEILKMTPIGSRHATCVRRLNRLFSMAAGARVIVDVQNPIRLGEHSEPQPDLALLRPRPDFYGSSHPGPQDVLLVVEVAETSATYDREVKLPLYARAGIPEVWLIDLSEEGIEIHRHPLPRGYQQVQHLRRGERLAPDALPDVSFAVEGILG